MRNPQGNPCIQRILVEHIQCLVLEPYKAKLLLLELRLELLMMQLSAFSFQLHCGDIENSGCLGIPQAPERAGHTLGPG